MATLTQAEKTKLALALRKSRRSLVRYRSIILSNEDGGEMKAAPFHKDWSDILLHDDQNFCIEAFRESAKTQYVIRAFCMHALTFPRVETNYIVIIKKNTKQAKRRLKQIWREYLENRVASGNLEEVIEKSSEAFEIQCTDPEGKMHFIRIEAYGKGASIRGLGERDRRPKIVIVDDPQDLKDATSETVQEDDWDWFLGDVIFLGKSTRIFLIGNNLGEKCIAERVFSEEMDIRFKTVKIPIMTPEGESAWPEYLTAEEIEEEKAYYRKKNKLDIWFRERMCQSLDEENRTFKREYFRTYGALRKADRLCKEMNLYIRTDLAISEKKKADYSVIEVFGVDVDDRWFIFDYLYGHWDPTTMIDLLFKTVVRWNRLSGKPLMNVGFPKVSYEAAFEHFVEKEMKKRNIYFTTMTQKQEIQKELRIQALQPRMKAGQILFPEDAEWLPELEGEFLMFPKGLRDDMIDTMGCNEQESQAPIGRKRARDLPRQAKVD